MQIKIPKWAQMIGLPVIIILVWLTASMFAQAIFIFAAAGVIALILDPLVRRLEWLKIPRYIGVFLVYLSLVALIVLFFVLVIPPVITQLTELVNALPGYTDSIREQLDSWRSSLERLNLPIDLGEELDKIVDRFQSAIIDLGSLLVQYSINVVSLITEFFIVIVISIYMLLDARRIGRFVRSFFPSDQQEDAEQFVLRTRQSVSHWVQAQALLSLLVGISTGLGIWFLGFIGVWPEGSQYSVFFGAWAAVTEFIPYVGPILGAVPPVVTAAFASPWAVVAVVLVFVFVQQVEGHILVPNIMGQVLGIHPLVVIFAVLAGAELRGIAGMLLTLPLLALAREVVVFFRPRISLEKFTGAERAPFAPEESPGAPAGQANNEETG